MQVLKTQYEAELDLFSVQSVIIWLWSSW